MLVVIVNSLAKLMKMAMVSMLFLPFSVNRKVDGVVETPQQ